MTEREFAGLKARIKEKEELSIRSQGAIDQIKESWKKNYGFDNLEDAKKKLDEIENEIMQKQERINKLEEKLLSVIPEDWK